MPLTDENMIAQYKKKYAIDLDTELTVYRSETANNEQTEKSYLVNDLDIPLWGSRVGIFEEVVIGGQHTLLDNDNVWTEYTGEV
jgi:hypothetical protein